jgi:hypothetical protein
MLDPPDIRAALSIEGPSHVEIVEPVDDGISGRQRVLGFHHVGLLDSCVHTRREHAVEALNIGLEARALTADGSTYVWFSEPSTNQGARFELLNEQARVELLGLPRRASWIGGAGYSLRDLNSADV